MPSNPRLSLGLVMLSRGYLTPEQLRTASNQSQRRKEPFDATLLRMELATEKQITAARSAQWGYPVLGQENIGHTVQSDIPRALLVSCSAVPLHYSKVAKRILLGFVYRIEHSVLESIEQMTGCRVEPCFITATDLAEQNERLTPIPRYREVFIDDPESPEKMARILGQAAVEIDAEEAEFAQCRDHIWARLKGKSGVTDVIFRMQRVATGTATLQPDSFAEAISSVG
jgi:hypothetical protein